jgi:2-methylisocitrate lyase-like PEP mutase family enzyme
MGSVSPPARQNAATTLRNMINTPGPIILGPGVYDGFSARIALGVGFDMIYMVPPPCSQHRIPPCACAQILC